MSETSGWTSASSLSDLKAAEPDAPDPAGLRAPIITRRPADFTSRDPPRARLVRGIGFGVIPTSKGENQEQQPAEDASHGLLVGTTRSVSRDSEFLQ